MDEGDETAEVDEVDGVDEVDEVDGANEVDEATEANEANECAEKNFRVPWQLVPLPLLSGSGRSYRKDFCRPF